MCYIGCPTRMVFKNARIGLSILALIAATASLSAQQAQQKGLQIVPKVKDDHLLVTIELRDGLTPDVRAAIDSGLKTIFTYTVELRLDAAGWFDRTVAQAVVTNTVEYDNLQRMHTLERRIDGRNAGSEKTPDAGRVREWMTSIKEEPLFNTRVLQRNREYYVRVSATARPSYGSILWPFGSGTSAQTRFVFFR